MKVRTLVIRKLLHNRSKIKETQTEPNNLQIESNIINRLKHNNF